MAGRHGAKLFIPNFLEIGGDPRKHVAILGDGSDGCCSTCGNAGALVGCLEGRGSWPKSLWTTGAMDLTMAQFEHFCCEVPEAIELTLTAVALCCWTTMWLASDKRHIG